MTSGRHAKFESVFATLTVMFFIYTVAVWRGLAGNGAFRPAGTALLAGGIMLQAVGPVVGRRFPRVQWVFLAASLVFLWYGVTAKH